MTLHNSMMERMHSNANFSDAGRMASMIGGGALAVIGLSKGVKDRSLPSLALGILGGGLLYKAATETRDSMMSGGAMPYKGGVVIEKSIVIEKPVEEVFGFWRKLENLPCFMEHLESVSVIEGAKSHWAAKGPAGLPIEWDATIINEIPNELIAWQSVAPANIDNAGSVHFTKLGDGATNVKVILRYDPPGKQVGAAIARLFGEEPGIQVEEDLDRLKQLLETGTVAAAAHESRSPKAARDISWPKGVNPVKDEVTEASEDSFPASDPPAKW